MDNIEIECIFENNFTEKEYKKFIIDLFELYIKSFLEEESINIDI